jgi:hypothetical protein
LAADTVMRNLKAWCFRMFVPDTADGSPDSNAARLAVRRSALSDAPQLAWAIHAARGWLGDEIEGAPPGMRRYHADLRLRVSETPSLVTFRKAAYVDIGPVRADASGWEAEINWRAASLAPLFPVFSGTIAARPGELSISGWYLPPGGTLGRLADRALLHIAAEGTARWFLTELDRVAAIGVA